MIAIPPSSGLSLRISVTDRCQLRCSYCMPLEGVSCCHQDEVLSNEDIALLASYLQQDFGLAKVRITGGEPLLRPGIEHLIRRLADLDIPDIGLTTNGMLLAEKAPLLKQAGLHRVNVSLDSLSPNTFHRLTGGGDVQTVRDGITAAIRQGLVPLKLNTVVIRGVNDTELSSIVAFALQEKCEVRFIELMPIGPGATLFPNGFMSSGAVSDILSSHYRMEPAPSVYGSSSTRYRVVDTAGRHGIIGFISSCSKPFCDECSRLRVTTDGRLLGCLARSEGLPVRELVRNRNRSSVAEFVQTALGRKRADRTFAQQEAMASIGG